MLFDSDLKFCCVEENKPSSKEIKLKSFTGDSKAQNVVKKAENTCTESRKSISKSVTFCLPNEYVSRQENEALNVEKMADRLSDSFNDISMRDDERPEEDDHEYDYVTADKVKEFTRATETSTVKQKNAHGAENNEETKKLGGGEKESPMSDINDEYIELKTEDVLQFTRANDSLQIDSASTSFVDDVKNQNLAQLSVHVEAQVNLDAKGDNNLLATYENVHNRVPSIADSSISKMASNVCGSRQTSSSDESQRSDSSKEYYNINFTNPNPLSHRSNPSQIMTAKPSLSLNLSTVPINPNVVPSVLDCRQSNGIFEPLNGMRRFQDHRPNAPQFGRANFNHISFSGVNPNLNPNLNSAHVPFNNLQQPSRFNRNGGLNLTQKDSTQLEIEEDEDQGGNWQYNLCMCYKNWKTALLSCFCPCVVEHQLSEKTKNYKLWQVLMLLLSICLALSVLITVCYFGKQHVLMWACIILAIVQLLQRIFFSAILRKRVRIFRNIAGVTCFDCCVMCFCYPCALCQMKQELDFWPDLHQSRT